MIVGCWAGRSSEENRLPIQIQVVAHDPAWQRSFEIEAQRIGRALGDIVVQLHHIGSTAIPDIFAKPIIDILLEVDGIGQLDHRSSTMVELGYIAMGEFGIPGRRYFHKDDASGNRTHQVHAFKTNSAEIERHLASRDYMIAHPSEAQMYSDLKRRLAREYPNDIEAYMEGKDAYIKEHEAKAIAWRLSQRS